MESIKDSVRLNNGILMPKLGFGLFKVEPNETKMAISIAIEAGYRSFDTAAAYENEAETGRAVKRSGIPRKEYFITTKLFNADHGYDKAMKAFDKSLRLLDMEYVDLYLIHWPGPDEKKRLKTWNALVDIYRSGSAKAIGVSNFSINHLANLIETSGMKPAVNQVELHPWLSQKPLLEYCKAQNIVVEAWAPLMQGRLLEEPGIDAIANKHGKTHAQVVLKWHWQNNVIAIPKSVHRERIYENKDIFDFTLDEGDIAMIDALNRNLRIGPDPDTFVWGF